MTESVFEVTASDGRKIRHLVPDRPGENSLAFLRGRLVSADYEVTGQVFDTDPQGQGGWVMPVRRGSSGPLATFLETHGDELLGWLEEQGFRPAKKRAD